MQQPGQERETLVGTITQSSGTYQGKVTFELPNKVRIDWFGTVVRSIGFDGANIWASDGKLAAQDLDLLETFLEDSPEGMLDAVRQSATLRVIATFARFDDGTKSNYSGPLVDIFQVLEPIASNSAKPMRLKYYFFNSKTRLLMETVYSTKASNGSTIAVKVQRSNWISTGGQVAPGTVTRIENGATVLTFGSITAAFSAAANDGTFSAP